jgi:hypothetical protein
VRTPAFRPVVLALIVLAGCTSPAPIATKQSTAPPLSTGIILSMRAIGGSAAATPWRAALLATASGGSDANDRPAPLTEFIVRADDGATLSIVQSNKLDLHTGDRVVIRYEPTAELARPG